MTTGGKVKDLLEKENIDFDEDSDDKLNVKLADSVKKIWISLLPAYRQKL